MILTAARVLASSQAEIITDGAVAVAGARITYVGQREHAPDGPVRDLGDVTLLPGLVDCHVHLCADPSAEQFGSSYASMTDLAPVRTLMISNALRLLDAGVTTARDLGSPGSLGTQVRDLLADSPVAAPRILAANAPVTVPGGHTWAMGGEAQGIEGVVARVRQRAAAGADVIKVMVTGGFMTPGTNPARAQFSLAELTALVEEAHTLGLPVTAHALGVEGIERAVRAGADGIEHCAWVTENGSRFDPGIAQAIAAAGVVVCPTMNAACTAESYCCPWDKREQVIGNLRRLRAAGVVLIAGTDCGIPLVPFEGFADCLAVFAEIGMTPREVIGSATTAAARACGLGDVTGRLEPGLAADMIAVPGDPTQETGVLRVPAFVMARGLEHRVRPRDVRRATAEERDRLLSALIADAAPRRQ